jgi:hypothetical protein
MRALTMSAFVLDGIAAAGFIAVMALSGGKMTPLDGFVLSALLLGFFSALGSMLIAAPEARPVLIHAARIPERRGGDRRVIDFGSPIGIERRSGRDRRLGDLTLGGVILTPRSGYPEYRFRS